MAPAAHPSEGALTVRKGMISRIECENFKYASLPPRGESSERRDPRASPPARVRLDGLLTVEVKIGVPNFLRASPSVLREYGVSNCLPV